LVSETGHAAGGAAHHLHRWDAAKASEVNGNFGAVSTRDDIDTRITTLPVDGHPRRHIVLVALHGDDREYP